MPKAKKKPRKQLHSILFNLKMSKRERDQLNAQAKRYSNGNLAAWLRFAGIRYKPIKIDYPT